MEKLLVFLSGKKTYVVAGLMLILGIIQQDQTMIMEALAIAFLRNGVAGVKK